MSALCTHVTESLATELDQLYAEIATLVEPLNEKQIWARPVEPGNSIGNLILHLTGNLNHFIGARLGNTGYVREREREFDASQGPAKEELLKNLQAAVALFRRVVTALPEEKLLATFPEPKFGSTLKALIHFVCHFALHRGQISYLARLVNSK